MAIGSVGVCLRADGSPQAVQALHLLNDWLQKRGLEPFYDRAAAEATGVAATPSDELAERVELVVALGGDGTLLRVARELGTRRVPIVGVNLGRLGYLTEFSVDEMIPALDRVLSGDYEIQSRMRLAVEILRDGASEAPGLALNEVVISTRASKMIDLETQADGELVTTYHADGLIVSTPTGSTAYSLSAGGPILLPGTNALLLTPICPHTLTQRPLVVAAGAQIDVRVESRGSEVTVTFDGHEPRELRSGDLVRISQSPHSVDLVASPFHSRFDILRSKLRWGQR